MKKLKFKPRVIGVAGTAVSGKDTVADYLVSKYGFKKIVLSDYLRQEARKRNLSLNRDSLRDLQYKLKEEYGREYLVAKAIETIQKKDHMKMKNVVIVGLRAPEETKLAKEKLKAKIIFVDANPFIRYKRAKSRKRIGFAKTYEQFLHEESLENAAFDFHKTIKMAHFKVDNTCPLRKTYAQVNKIAKKLKLKKIS